MATAFCLPIILLKVHKMEEISVIKKSVFLGKEIDIWGTAEEPLFRASDVAEWLEMSNVTDMVSRVDQEELTKLNLGSRSGETWFLTEDGLYEVLMQSRKPIAKQFKRGVKNILKEIRLTGRFSSTAAQPQSSISDKIMVAKFLSDFLNLNEASKLGIAHKIGKMVGLDDALPQAVNAGTAHPVTHAATDLLRDFGVGISAQAFNKVLDIKGVVKQATRPGKQGKVHKWYVITPAFDKYGENQQDPKYQQQIQIRWYDSLFRELLTIVGLNSQQALLLNH